MQAHNSTIEEFLSTLHTVFIVPVYQRNYDWKEANCKQLFQDICHVIDTKDEHFLGTICFKDYSSHERSIIDGQQRLTSITLLLKAIYDITDDQTIQEEIRDSYFYNRGHSIDTDFLKIKLHLNKRDDAIYHKLLENNMVSIDSALTTRQKESRIYQNYKIFYRLLRKYMDRGGKVGAILDALCDLTIIELEVQHENPQEIFESLNSTGLDLTPVDLLRNYFLMQFSNQEQTELYEDYWNKVESNIGVDFMEPFFVDYLIFKRRNNTVAVAGRRMQITEKNLYIAFKDYYLSIHAEGDFEKTKAFFNDLKKCSEIYKAFIFRSDVNIEKESAIRKKLYYLLDIMQAKKSRSLLLYLLKLFKDQTINSQELNDALDAVSSLVFRAKICKQNGISTQFAANVMARLDVIKAGMPFTDYFWKTITFGKGSYAFPNDDMFKQALLQKDIYQALRSRGTKYMFYMLERHSPFPKGLPAFEDETLSIKFQPRNPATSVAGGIGFFFILVLDVLFYYFFTHIAKRTHKITIGP